MTDLTKIAGSQKNRLSLGVGELIATAVVLLLLIAVQVMFIDKHPVTLNAAAEQAPFGIITP
jgi:hypothetical protein